MTQPAARLITLILLLQRRPNQKAADLAAELGISIRSLHRYFAMLDEIGIPVYTERGRHGGFSLVRGYKLPPLVFSPEEAVALALGTSAVAGLWGELYREAASGALAKLENVLPDAQREEVAWARRALVVSGLMRDDPSILAPTLEILRQAVHDHHRVHLRYRSSGQPDASERDLDPYALVYRHGWWYVVGFDSRRKEVRTFRLDRIESIGRVEATFETPADFDARAYLETPDQPLLTARIRFAPGALTIARSSRPLWDTFEEQVDGSVMVTLRVPDLVWATSTVLAFGPAVTVLEPPELIREIRGWAEAILKTYSSGSGDVFLMG